MNNGTPTLVTADGERPGIRDVYEVVRLPALFAILTAAIRWLIWYHTNTRCTLELAPHQLQSGGDCQVHQR